MSPAGSKSAIPLLLGTSDLLSCGEKGHTVRRCKQPIKEEEAGTNDDGGVAGGFENLNIGNGNGVWHPDIAPTGNGTGNDWEHNNGDADYVDTSAPAAPAVAAAPGASSGW